jgi:hypothetical protein
MRGQTPPRSRLPRLSPPRGLGVGEISASFETTFGGRKLRPNYSAGRDAFIRQPLRCGGRGADGVRRRQLALAIMPHSKRDRRLISLHPPLCRYSRRGAGLWNSVRTCLTPPATVPPTPCTFPLHRAFQRAWAVTLERSTALDWGKTWAAAPSMPHLIRRGVLRTSTAITTPLTGATGQGRAPGMGGRIRKDDSHGLRHAPQRSATGRTNCSPPDHGGRSRRPH